MAEPGWCETADGGTELVIDVRFCGVDGRKTLVILSTIEGLGEEVWRCSEMVVASLASPTRRRVAGPD
jgi:hypothetical protein